MPVLAELSLSDSSVQLVRLQGNEFDNVYSGDKHLLNLAIERQGRLAKGLHQVGRYAEGGNQAFLGIGSVVFRPAGLRVEARGIAPSRALQCWLSDDRMEIVRSAVPTWTQDRLARTLDIKSRDIGFYMARLLEEAVRPSFASSTRADAILVLALSDIAEFLAGKRPLGSGKGHGSTERLDVHQSTLKKVMERICDIAEVTPSVSELADLASLSERHLLRVFQKAYGTSLISYIRDLRLQRAQHYLAMTDMPLKQVAACLGFSSQANFTTAFRHEMRTTPRAYRREHRSRIAYTRSKVDDVG